MLSDTTKLLAGPFLALVPLLTWELVLKPARTRRNVALVLIAEIKQCLGEIAYYRLRREEDREHQLVNLLLPRSSFIALQSLVAELSPVTLGPLIQFYGTIAKLDSTHDGLESTFERWEKCTNPADKQMLDLALQSGYATLDLLLETAWATGCGLVEQLTTTVRESWMDAPELTFERDTLVEAAKARRDRLVVRAPAP